MALSEDQRALLRLLVAGDTYERVAEVLGTGVDDVRARAHEAANALGREPNPEMPPEAVRGRLEALEDTSAGHTVITPPPSAGARTRLALWGVAGGAVLILLVVLLVVGIGGGGGGDTSTSGG